MKTVLYLLLSVTIPAFSAALSCYNCDPSTVQSCKKPQQTNPEEILCTEYNSEILQGRGNNNKNAQKNDNFECYSVYVTSELDKGPGVYRGCLLKQSTTENSCYVLKQLFNNRGIIHCQSCSDESLCNVHDVRSDNVA